MSDFSVREGRPSSPCLYSWHTSPSCPNSWSILGGLQEPLHLGRRWPHFLSPECAQLRPLQAGASVRAQPRGDRAPVRTPSRAATCALAPAGLAASVALWFVKVAPSRCVSGSDVSAMPPWLWLRGECALSEPAAGRVGWGEVYVSVLVACAQGHYRDACLPPSALILSQVSQVPERLHWPSHCGGMAAWCVFEGLRYTRAGSCSHRTFIQEVHDLISSHLLKGGIPLTWVHRAFAGRFLPACPSPSWFFLPQCRQRVHPGLGLGKNF